MQTQSAAPSRSRSFVHVLLMLAAGLSGVLIVLPARPSIAAKTGTRPSPNQTRVDAATRFEYVAVFPAATPSSSIETWRREVLVRSHTQGCSPGRSCVQRLLRGSGLGRRRVQTLGFDLATATPAAERAAILAAAVAHAPHPHIEPASSLQRAAELPLRSLPQESQP